MKLCEVGWEPVGERDLGAALAPLLPRPRRRSRSRSLAVLLLRSCGGIGSGGAAEAPALVAVEGFAPHRKAEHKGLAVDLRADCHVESWLTCVRPPWICNSAAATLRLAAALAAGCTMVVQLLVGQLACCIKFP